MINDWSNGYDKHDGTFNSMQHLVRFCCELTEACCFELVTLHNKEIELLFCNSTPITLPCTSIKHVNLRMNNEDTLLLSWAYNSTTDHVYNP